MSEVRTFTDRFARLSLTDVERVLPLDGQLVSVDDSLTGRSFVSPARPVSLIRVTFYGIGEPPRWLESTVSEIARLADLRPDWDSYAARATEVGSVMAAFEALSLALAANADAPLVLPAKDGGIRLEWHRDGRSLEITAAPRRREAFFANDATNDEWEVDYNSFSERVVAALRMFGE